MRESWGICLGSILLIERLWLWSFAHGNRDPNALSESQPDRTLTKGQRRQIENTSTVWMVFTVEHEEELHCTLFCDTPAYFQADDMIRHEVGIEM